MTDPILPQASLFLGIIPALVLLFFSLKGYEGYYKDKNIFLTFVIGLIIGFISAVAEIFTIQVGILYIILFPVFEQLFKTIILNVRRLHEKQQTVIYGLTLGLGFGSIFTPITIIIASVQPGNLIDLVSVIIGSIGIIMFHGASGLIIGYGIYIGKLSKYLFLAIVSHFVITSTILITIQNNLDQFLLLLVIYGFILYVYSTKRIMTRIKVEGKKRKRISKN